MLDEYFGSSEFQSYVDAADSILMHSTSSASMSSSSLPTPTSQIPPSHQLSSASPFVDSGIGLNVMAASQYGSHFNYQNSFDDDVFVIEDDGKFQNTDKNGLDSRLSIGKICNSDTLTSVPSPKSNATASTSAPQPNGLTRSRRSHFSHGDANPDANKDAFSKQSAVRVTYENERLVYFSKSPHSWALPRDWLKICELYPTIVRNKVCDNINNNNNNYVSNANFNKFTTKYNNHPQINMLRRQGVLMSE